MSFQDAASHFHQRDFAKAAIGLKKHLASSNPRIQHNLVISEYHLKPSTRQLISRSASSPVSKLDKLLQSYPDNKSQRAIIQFNRAQCLLIRHQYSDAVNILKSLIVSTADVPISIYVRSCWKLLTTYFHHEMVEEAQHIYHKYLLTLSTDDISKLSHDSDPTVSPKKHQYWIHIFACQLYLSKKNTDDAFKELKSAIAVVKSQSQSVQQSPTKSRQTFVGFKMLDRVRLLFLRAHCELLNGSNQINLVRTQLFGTNRDLSEKSAHESIAFLNNMSCIYAFEGKPGSAMLLIQKALLSHAKFVDSAGLYHSDYMLSYLCYNAGIFLQQLQAYGRAIDAFISCLPTLQSRPRLWLRMAQCILAIWEPVAEFKNYRDGQRQMNSLTRTIVEAQSMERGNLFVLPSGKRPIISSKKRQFPQWKKLAWEERNDDLYGFPYQHYKTLDQSQFGKETELTQEKMQVLQARDDEIVEKIKAIREQHPINEARRTEAYQYWMEQIGKKSDKTDDSSTAPASSKAKQKQSTDDEKGSNSRSTPDDDSKESPAPVLNSAAPNTHSTTHKTGAATNGPSSDEIKNEIEWEYQRQIRETEDTELAVEWLTSAITLFKKLDDMNETDNAGHLSAHLHLSYAYLKLECWEFALGHAEVALKMLDGKTDHQSFLASVYAAECCLHLNRLREAKSYLDPHLESLKQSQKPDTPATPDGINGDGNSEDEKSQKTEDESPMGRKSNDLRFGRRRLSEKEMNPTNATSKSDLEYCTQCVNMATCYIVEGVLHKGFLWTWQALHRNNNFYPAIRLLVYLHIRNGSIDSALDMLKYRRRIPVHKWLQKKK